MKKIIQLDERAPQGDPSIQPLLLWTPSGRASHERVKTASEASEYCKTVAPQPGKTVVLVIAVSSYEYFDANRNADGFNEAPYKQGVKPLCGCCDADPGGWITAEETIQQHYKSFLTAKNYMHHANKDETKSVGSVLASFWNASQHRVELIVGFENEKAPEIVQRIADREFPAVSMGCRIAFDRCNYCGHKAPTRAKYCDHLKYSLRQVGKTGLRYAALNPSPRWFDISWVIKPADQIGYMMRKVAHSETLEVRSSAEAGEYLDHVDAKIAAIRKVSSIDKIIRGIPVDAKTTPLSKIETTNIERYRDHVMPALVGSMPEFPDDTIKSFAKHPVAKVLSTLSAAGVILTTPEFVKLLVERLSPGTVIPEETLDTIVALQGHVFDLYAQHPQLLDQVVSSGLFDINAKNVDPVITNGAMSYIEKRSSVGDYIARSMVPQALRDEEPHYTDTLHVTDPATGQHFTTNRGAAVAAHDAIAKEQVKKMIGGGALLAGGYKLLAAGLPKMLHPVAAATAGLLGYKHLAPDYGPQYMTEEGVPISTLTEMMPEKQSAEMSSIALPVLGTAALVTALGHDYDTRLRRGEVGNPEAPIQRQLIDRLGSYASDHPALALMGGLTLASKLGSLTDQATDSVQLPDVDIDLAATKLGALLSA